MIRDVFVDTNVWLALVNPRDRHHARVREWFLALGETRDHRLWTSDYVVAEALDWMRARFPHRRSIDRLLDAVFGSNEMPPVVHQVLRVHGARFAQALELYRQRFDQGLSFTDWTHVALVQEHGLDAVATFDGGFAAHVAVVDALRLDQTSS